jgi:hypothetical protein
MRNLWVPLVLIVAFTIAAVEGCTGIGEVSQVFTHYIDTPVTVRASSGLNFPIPFDVKQKSTLIISVSLQGIAFSEREWGINCSGSTVTCEPFSFVEHFSPDKRHVLSFTVVAREVPEGPGTVNLFVFAECAVACNGTEELTVQKLIAVIEAAEH